MCRVVLKLTKVISFFAVLVGVEFSERGEGKRENGTERGREGGTERKK